MKKKKKKTLKDVSEDNPRYNRYIYGRDVKTSDRTEVEFLVCLVFQSDEQAKEFIDNLPKEIPVLHNMYVDGQEMADVLGIKVTPNNKKPIDPRVSDQLKEMTKKFSK